MTNNSPASGFRRHFGREHDQPVTLQVLPLLMDKVLFLLPFQIPFFLNGILPTCILDQLYKSVFSVQLKKPVQTMRDYGL